MDDLITKHLDWCQDVGHARNTIMNRGYVLRSFSEWLRGQGVELGVEVASAVEIRKWLGTRPALATRRNYRVHLLGFFHWATEVEEVLDWSPMGRVPKYRVPALVPRPVADELFFEILARSVQPWRLVAVLGGFAGLRCCEIAGLTRVDVTSTSIRVTGKGGKVGEIDTHPLVWEELSNFPGAAPFIVQAGGRASAKWISRTGGVYYKRLGFPVSVHMFRHRFGTEFLRQTGNLRAAQAALRHSSITATVGYTAVVNGERRSGVLALPVPPDQAAS